MADGAYPDTESRGLTRGTVRSLSLLGLVLVWWLSAQWARSPNLCPGPIAVLAVAWNDISDGTLPLNLAITLVRVIAAFSVAMATGSVLRYWAGRSSRADAMIDPWIVVALNLPVL